MTDAVYKEYLAVKENFGPEIKLYSQPNKSLDFKPSKFWPMPEVIDPDNWKELTPKDKKAHEERLAIRGRLRREFWTKKYHPINGHFFNETKTDPAAQRFIKANEVYFVSKSYNFCWKTVSKVMLSTFGLGFFLVYCELNSKFHHQRFDPVVPADS